ncbi:transcription regulator protein BACH1 [Pangasianodon hypophthalmus]|uniref:transcription regulator protein BACH1 n=1 Tax=Pangasianodon hypophthalmus TaxID=310915 RepID=UPI0023074FC9|nr:transcription regulator protein BACH1 [Pangasianodon hypophthalmus]
MSVDGSRTSVFTFQSAVHSMHVLRCLDEQRQKDILCDVTVEVESRSFRAHCSVLACCSAYFYTRLLNHTGWNSVITLPEEVTVEGFVPLLQFAYTAKLHFTKENILEIHRCAELLGFHNLDKACFEFLIPKFSDGSETTQEAKRKSKNSSKSKNSHEKSPAASGECDSTEEQCTNTEGDGVALVTGDQTVQNVSPSDTECPNERPSVTSDKNILDFPSVSFQSATDQQTELCLQNCGPQLVPSSSVPTGQVCPFLSMPCSSESDNVHPVTAGCDGGILNRLAMDDVQGECLNMPNVAEGQIVQPVRDLEPASDCSQLRPLSSRETSEVLDSIASVSNLESIESINTETFDPPEQIFPNPAHSDGSTERSTVEREVAEHLAKGFWPDMSSSLTETPEHIEPAAAGNGSDFHWLKHLDLGAAPDECPFLRDLNSKEDPPSLATSPSRETSRASPFVSPINSGDNSECEHEADSVVSSEQACEVDLPFPVEQISSMSRRAFLQILKEQRLTPEQLEFVQDVRRRSKNRMAAQRSRKRKLDCIYKLEGDIKKLRIQKEKLLQEHNQLKQSMEETQQSLSGLCESVCTKSSMQPEQLHILARYLSPDSPSSVLLTPTASPNLPCLEAWSSEPTQPDCAQANGAVNNNNNNINNNNNNDLGTFPKPNDYSQT